MLRILHKSLPANTLQTSIAFHFYHTLSDPAFLEADRYTGPRCDDWLKVLNKGVMLGLPSHSSQLGEFLSWRVVDSSLSEALRSADGPGRSWSLAARWGDDEKIRLQMADITLRLFRVRQHGGGRQGTMPMRVTALSRRGGKHATIPGEPRERKGFTARLNGNPKCS